MDNYYEKLKANFPVFGSSLRLDERQQKSLESLIGFTEGALSSFRSKVQEADSEFADFNEKIKGEKRTEALRESKAKSIGSIEAEFNKVQDRVPRAQGVLHDAIHQGKPQKKNNQPPRKIRMIEFPPNTSSPSASQY